MKRLAALIWAILSLMLAVVDLPRAQATAEKLDYVREHFGDPATMALEPEHAKLAAYFNSDNGTGRVRGIWLQSNLAVGPIFDQWIRALRDRRVRLRRRHARREAPEKGAACARAGGFLSARLFPTPIFGKAV